ncbi:MAG: hypothetical protein JWL90_3525 [Chthoniobacteraceae bacterium]|nr:hypothetical protein [Chthoniobacteraceae bacterium]
MAKLLLGFSLLFIVLTGGLSFMTKTKVDALQSTLKDTKGTLATTKSTLTKTEGSLKSTQGELTAAKTTIDENSKEIAKQKSDLTAATESLKTAQADVLAKSNEVEELKKLQVVNPAVPGGPDINVTELQDKLAKAQTALAEAEALRATFEKQKQDAEEKLVGSQREVKSYKDQTVANGLSGKILAYNPGWAFVVLSIGDRQGLKANAQMIVTRNGQSIGKVKVTSVEPGNSIADIVPGSVAKGMFIQPGDSVVYEAKR